MYYQVIVGRVGRQIATPYRIFPDEWCQATNTLKIDGVASGRTDRLYAINRCVQWDKKRMMKIAEQCLGSTIFTVDSLVEIFRNEINNISFFSYTERLIDRLLDNGQIRTSETYRSTLNSFKRFRQQCDLQFAEIDGDMMLAYEYYLRDLGVSVNTISFYIRRLRAVYNRAIDDGIVENNRPFKRVFTSSEKTIKRAIQIEYIKRLKDLDLSFSQPKAFARDMFLFSFYTRGMSFVDIAYLSKSNLLNGVLSYRRKKTNQLLHIRWENCMQEIVERYAARSDSPYIFDIIAREDNCRKMYLNVLTRINRHLKSIGRMIGLDRPLSMYTARHSWASIAKSEGISISIISESMGHDSESTTRIYLASLESSVIDDANQQILTLI